MCQQKQQRNKRLNIDGYLYTAESCLSQTVKPDKLAQKKGGSIVVITPARNPRESQQCRINEFIPCRGTSNCPLLGGETIQVLRDSTQMKGLKHAIRNTDNRGT